MNNKLEKGILFALFLLATVVIHNLLDDNLVLYIIAALVYGELLL